MDETGDDGGNAAADNSCGDRNDDGDDNDRDDGDNEENEEPATD